MSLDFLWMEVLQSLAVKALFTAPWPAIQCCGWFTKSFAAWDGFIRNAIHGYILAMLFWVHPAEWCTIPQRKLLLLRVFSVRFWYQEIFYIFEQTSGFASQREWAQADVEVVPGRQNISKQHCCWQLTEENLNLLQGQYHGFLRFIGFDLDYLDGTRLIYIVFEYIHVLWRDT